MKPWLPILVLTLASSACAILSPLQREGIPGETYPGRNGVGAGLRTLSQATPIPRTWAEPYTTPSPTPQRTPTATRPDRKRSTAARQPQEAVRHHLALELHGLAYSSDLLWQSDQAISDFAASAQGWGLAVGDAIGDDLGQITLGYRYEQMAVPIYAITLSDGPLTLRTHELYIELAAGAPHRFALGFSAGLGFPEHSLAPAVQAACPGCQEELTWGLGGRGWLGYSYPLAPHLRFKLSAGMATYYHSAKFSMPGKAQSAAVNFQWFFARPGIELVF